MEKRIPYEKALEILEKIDDSYFSEAVTSDYKLLDEVWQMLWLAQRTFADKPGICGHPDPAGALGEPGEPIETDRIAEEPMLDERNGEKGRWVMGRFFPMEWIQQRERREEDQ